MRTFINEVCRTTPVLSAACIWMLGAILSGCLAETDSAAFQKATPICTILKNAQKYDGQNILVEGIYRWEPHGAIFFGKACSHDEVRPHFVNGYDKNQPAKSAFDSLVGQTGMTPVNVVYRATFHVVKGLSCFGITCFKYEIEVSELVAARAA